MITDSPEHAMIRRTVGEIADDFGHEYFAQRARGNGHVDELWDAAAKAGFVGVNIPERFGGGGMGMTELAIVIEELAARGCPLLMLIVSPAICGSILARHGTAAQQDEWLTGIGDGTKRMAFAITEADAGSNSYEISTMATRDGDTWRLTGAKTFITGVDDADAILVVAKTTEPGGDSNARDRLSLFIVPTDAEGLERQEIAMELITPERQYTLFFDDVAVPADSMVGTVGAGLRVLFTGLNPERIAAAATANGIGRYAIGKAVEYARERTVWRTPIGAHQGIAHPLAEAHAGLQLARLATQHAAALYDADEDAAEAVNIAKLASADAAELALDRAIQTHGGSGFTSEIGLADLWFVVRSLRTVPVSREMILNHIAQHSLGLPTSY
ncbi:MAG: acyl-CoA dehydrogenase family protein [Acidimicrobiia bacterium]